MSQEDIIKAWKDEDYRNSLGEETRAALPAHPAGLLELTDEALDDLIANGGANRSIVCSFICSIHCTAAPSSTVGTLAAAIIPTTH